MKFSASIVAVIAATSAVSDVSAFGINNLAVRRSTFTSSTARTMALDDLESKLLSDPAPTKTKKERAPKKQKKVKAPEPEPEPVVEATKSKYAPKKKEKRVKKANPNAYDLSGVDEVAKPKVTQTKKAPPAPKPKKEKPAPVKKEKPAPKPKKVKPAPVVKAPSPPPKSTSVATKDPNAGLGVVVGGAPLLLAPLVALSATRGALSKTAARREAIQEAAAEKERQAKAKAAVDTDVDSGGIVGALVSLSNSICHLMVDGCDRYITTCHIYLHSISIGSFLLCCGHLTHRIIPFSITIQQGFLGAGVAAVGFAVTQSIAGSSGGGINLPAVSAPKISAPKVSAPKIGGGAPKAAVAPKSFIKDPKGEI